MVKDAPTGTAAESTGRHRAGRSAGVTGPADRRARPGRGLRLTAVLGLGLGLLVLAIPAGATVLRPYLWGGDSGPAAAVPVAAASRPPTPVPTEEAGPTPSGTPEVPPSPTTSPLPPRATNAPGPTPSARSVPTRTAVPGATPTQGPGGTSRPPAAELPPPPPPEPVLLGPDGRDELARMMDRYCDRHVGGTSWADPRGDGRWECERLLLSSRTVDMDTACRDTYGDGAFARNDTGDAFDWRCFRR
ncbi:hypothetical protein I0C86_06845 [Plantactinospora sp. S1510]|uniref:Uncharacterized protein n=1 Tax=Plantactinospora alkalitolerans TaxID=2789879 RepID=A0ABS0GR79_9ACTN|nr:hypothetical protein [Plantactinospora alkalitolerans]MBF9128706.1 hypothetical protein [Plantactinospora alkalitolerans]